jgi:hypothetical protein
MRILQYSTIDLEQSIDDHTQALNLSSNLNVDDTESPFHLFIFLLRIVIFLPLSNLAVQGLSGSLVFCTYESGTFVHSKLQYMAVVGSKFKIVAVRLVPTTRMTHGNKPKDK